MWHVACGMWHVLLGCLVCCCGVWTTESQQRLFDVALFVPNDSSLEALPSSAAGGGGAARLVDYSWQALLLQVRRPVTVCGWLESMATWIQSTSTVAVRARQRLPLRLLVC